MGTKTWSALLLTALLMLTGCVGSLWTGASMIYDRHNVYKKVNDYYLSAKIQHALYYDKLCRLPNGMVDVTVFHKTVLLSGHVPDRTIYDEVVKRVNQIKGYQHLYNAVSIADFPVDKVEDSWITTKIKSQILLDSSLDPNDFKIITSDRIVYLMGEVKHDQANKVVQIASDTSGVQKVVKLMKYYKYE